MQPLGNLQATLADLAATFPYFLKKLNMLRGGRRAGKNAKMVKGGKRLRSKMFAELQSHYLFEDRFGRPGKGNDKGKVEGLVGFARRNFMTPLPVAESFDALNSRLLDACTKRRQAILRGQRTTIAERMQADLAAFMMLPRA